jgi:2-C-methyl-D-erythritol 4-phosphate cytidylyltransferase
MTVPRHFALIPAAGVGARMGAEYPKQYLALAGKPMLRHVADTFAAAQVIDHTFIVVSPDDAYITEAMADAAYTGSGARVSILYCGGATRRDSVLNGLRTIREQVGDADWVLVHDAARPGLVVGLIDRLVHALRDDPVGGLLAIPVVDTLKRADDYGRVQATVERRGLWAAQTPQMFRYALLRRALEQSGQVTDEAGAIEALGFQPKLVEGNPRNFKLTLPHDIVQAELYLKESND